MTPKPRPFDWYLLSIFVGFYTLAAAIAAAWAISDPDWTIEQFWTRQGIAWLIVTVYIAARPDPHKS